MEINFLSRSLVRDDSNVLEAQLDVAFHFLFEWRMEHDKVRKKNKKRRPRML